MKNQYVGDIGDYGKYGLLRYLAEIRIRIGKTGISQIVTDLFLMAGLEAVQTNHNIDDIRVETKNKLGGVISTRNTDK